MKKKSLYGLLALALVFTMALPMLNFALILKPTSPTDRTKLHVRVNGYEVDFPDAQPYIDENGRTMIPLRFATEALGAEVTWEQSTKTASIAKDGIVVKVTIGKDTISVTESGSTQYVVMNTTAVLKEGRTYVPIRFVAEALGAYVDYSASYKTVGIYQDVLTAEEITKLHEYSRNVISSDNEVDDTDEYKKEFLESFASAREISYDIFCETNLVTKFDDLGVNLVGNDKEKYFETLAKEAAAELAFQSDTLTIEFKTDASSVYSEASGSRIHYGVRGYLLFTNNGYDYYNNPEGESHAKLLGKLVNNAAKNGKCESLGVGGFKNLGNVGETVKIPIDVQMEVSGGSKPTARAVTIIILDDPV